ncbi:stage II sporulation protein P [Orenia metallireducens]|uniref:Stage II sporulation protein P n=1 Tax=Orenia metallireducens TaxID=1413210 RepID=A0A1C0A512_9FIRM|nr:stage II sporulation protein P [Orenia metallireducens]OCL25230.1 stage II sporulation protein P [Orenia metallireducens]
MFKDQHRFITGIILLYLILFLVFSGLVVHKYSIIDKISLGNIFSTNKLIYYLVNFLYLDDFHSKLVLRKGLPIVRVENQEMLAYSQGMNPFIKLTCSFTTDLPPSFFKLKDDVRVASAMNRVRTRKKQNQSVEEKLRAEGTHDNEERVKIELEFWQTEPSKQVEEREVIERIAEENDSQKTLFPKKDTTFSNEALVGIYHTHTAENYDNKGYNARAAAGDRGDIVLIGDELTKTLKEKYGILVAHSRHVNDKTYGSSYINSFKTAQGIVDENPKLKMIFDIHRDAIGRGSKDLITTTIDGEKVARIMIIVTNNEYGLPHPNWQQNVKFAKRLGKKMNEMYPGLLRDVKLISNRRYNQHVHPHALLLEIGGAKNTLEEAKRSSQLLANVLASLINEGV